MKVLKLFFCLAILLNSSLFAQKNDTITIIGVGDIMLGTTYPEGFLPPSDGKYLLKPVDSILKKADITFGNHSLYYPSQGKTVWGQNFTNPPGQNTANLALPTVTWPYGRHFNGISAAFCDGHAKWIADLETVYNGGNDKPLYDPR